MNNEVFKRLLLLVALCLIQSLVLNHIHLFYCATPLLYILLPLYFPTDQPRWSALLWSFCLGLLVDVFSNTPGVAAGAMAFVGLVQPYVLAMFAPHDTDAPLRPSLKEMGWLKFTTYALLVVLAFCVVFFLLESFSFFNWMLILMSIGGSTLLTLIIIIIIEKLK